MSDGDHDWPRWLQTRLDALRRDCHWRTLRPVSIDAKSGRTRRDGHDVVLFSGNDYLGLAAHPEIRRAAADAALRWGMGPRGAALVCGDTTEHEALRAELAELFGCERVVLTPTGFAANLAVLDALAGPDLTICSDRLAHASIIDGCRLARGRGATVRIFAHADPTDLEGHLLACTTRRTLVVTDAVFSMDGDLAPLRAFAELKRRYGFLLVIDEAHATLVFGADKGISGGVGAGLADALGLGDVVDVRVGTLSKAIGAQGGFVATTAQLGDWLLHRGRASVFSTALPVPVVAAARAAIARARCEPELHRRLWHHVGRVASHLGVPAHAPIVPLVLGTPERVLAAAEALHERGVELVAIRPPTVPEGTSRLRLTVSAAHTDADIDRLLAALDEVVPYRPASRGADLARPR